MREGGRTSHVLCPLKKTIDNRCGGNRVANVWKPIHLQRARGKPPCNTKTGKQSGFPMDGK